MKLAIVGCTGLVGSEVLDVLTELSIPIKELILVASEKNIGKKVEFKYEQINIVSIQEAIDQMPRTIKNIFNFEINDTLLITGGGAHNKFWINKLKELNINAVVPEIKLTDFKEALIFSLLGVLKVRNEINILSSVTGSSKDLSSGVIHNP